MIRRTGGGRDSGTGCLLSPGGARFDLGWWVRAFTLASLVLMVIGHLRVAGAVFDPLTGETYNVFTRWVSDFAAKQPEGWWIKGSIAMFCLAIIGLFRRLAVREAVDLAGVWRGFGVLLMATLMVGGLVLVAVFDLSPRQYQIIESRVLLDQARSGDVERMEEPGWWELLMDPKGATLREGLLRDTPLPEEEMRELKQRILDEEWGEEKVLGYLREKVRLEEEARDAEAAALEPLTEVRRELRPVPKGAREYSKHWYHRLGFQLFLAGFACASVWMARVEWRQKAYRRLPGTLLMLSLTLLFGAWLMAEKLGLAGIPQRALLGLIALWVVRALPHAERDA